MPTEAEIKSALAEYAAQFQRPQAAPVGLPTAPGPGGGAFAASGEGPGLPAPTPRTLPDRPYAPEGGSTPAQIGFSFKRPDQRLSYLQSLYGGPDNAFQNLDTGEFFIRNPETKAFEPFVPERLGDQFAAHFKDFAKFAAVTGIAPARGASLGVKALQGAAQMGALEGIDTGVSNVLPGDASTPGQFAGDVALGAGAGAVAPVIGEAVAKGIAGGATLAARGLSETNAAFQGAKAGIRAYSGAAPTTRLGRLRETLHAAATTPAQLGLRFMARRAGATPQAAEGVRALSKVGLQNAASMGQITQDPLIQTTEQYARLHPLAQRRAMEGDARRASIAMKQLEGLTSQLESGARTSTDKGLRLARTFDRAVGSMEKVRSNNADVLYGRVKELAGDAPLFDVRNSYTEIVKQIGDHSAPGETATVADLLRLRAAWRGDQISEEAAIKQAQAVINSMRHPISGAPPPDKVVAAILSEVDRAKAAGAFDVDLPKLTASQMRHLQRVYGGRATRTGNLFTDLQGNAVSRGVAAKIAGALGADLDDAAKAGGLPGDVAEAIRKANAQYRADSGRIDEALSLTLAKALGKTRSANEAALSPNAVLDKWFKLEPHQKRMTRRILTAHDPQFNHYLGAEAFRRAMDAATGPGTPALYPHTGGEVRFDVRKFYQNLPTGEDWDVLWEGTPYARIVANDMKKALGRLANEGNVVVAGAREGAFFRFRVGLAMATGAAAKSVTAPTQAASEVAVLLSPNTIAEGLLTSEGQRHLHTLSKFAGKTVSQDKIEPVTRAIAYFAAKKAEEEAVGVRSSEPGPVRGPNPPLRP